MPTSEWSRERTEDQAELVELRRRLVAEQQTVERLSHERRSQAATLIITNQDGLEDRDEVEQETGVAEAVTEPRTIPEPESVPTIRSRRMMEIIVDASLRRPGTESADLIRRLEAMRQETAAALEPIRKRLYEGLEELERIYGSKESMDRKRARIAALRAALFDSLLSVVSPEKAREALAVSPSFAKRD